MAITVAPIFTPILDTELDIESPVSEEVAKKFIQNINMLLNLSPISSMIMVAINTPGIVSPNSVLFQLADGGEITDLTSPLHSSNGIQRFTPNMQSSYFTPANDEMNNNLVGNVSVDLTHDHGGATGVYCHDPRSRNGNDHDETDPRCHVHTVSPDLGVTPVTPYAYTVAFYQRIN